MPNSSNTVTFIRAPISTRSFASLQLMLQTEFIKLRDLSRSGKVPATTNHDARQLTALLAEAISRTRVDKDRDQKILRQWANCVRHVRQRANVSVPDAEFVHNDELWECIMRVTSWLWRLNQVPPTGPLTLRVPDDREPPVFIVSGPEHPNELAHRQRVRNYVGLAAIVGGALLVPTVIRLFTK